MRPRKKTYEEQATEISEVTMRFISKLPPIERTELDWENEIAEREAAENEWFKNREKLIRAWFNDFGCKCIFAAEVTVIGREKVRTSVSMSGIGASVKKDWLRAKMSSMGYEYKSSKCLIV